MWPEEAAYALVSAVSKLVSTPGWRWDRLSSLNRRAFLLTAGAAGIGVAKTSLAPAHQLVRSGALGSIVFCRVFQGDGRDWLSTLQFLLDAPRPVSVTPHGAGRATLRYPGFIASLERARGLEEYGIVICGSHATLTIGRDGWRMFGQEA
jgi:hypothetical protein